MRTSEEPSYETIFEINAGMLFLKTYTPILCTLPQLMIHPHLCLSLIGQSCLYLWGTFFLSFFPHSPKTPIVMITNGNVIVWPARSGSFRRIIAPHSEIE